MCPCGRKFVASSVANQQEIDGAWVGEHVESDKKMLVMLVFNHIDLDSFCFNS